MKLEDQCVSLELAKKLKERGIEKESLFYYVNIDGEGKYYLYYEEALPEEIEYEGETISAFTVAELFEMLPAIIDTKQNEPFNCFWFMLNKRRVLKIQYVVNYHCDTTIFNERPADLIENNIYGERLPDVLANMLIYLIENKFMELP